MRGPSWEHTFRLDVTHRELAHILTAYGAEGWELVAVTHRQGEFDLFCGVENRK